MAEEKQEQVYEAGGMKFEHLECPHCKKKFLLHIKTEVKKALEGLGDAIGEAKFGE